MSDWMNAWETFRLETQTFDGNSTANTATELIDARGYRLAKIYVPSNWTAAKIVVKDSATLTGTPAAIKDDLLSQNVAVPVTAGYPVGLKEYVLPLSGLGFIKLGSVSASDGSTAVGQVGTKATKAITMQSGKVMTFTSGVGGAASDAITVAVEVAQDDTLAVSASGKAILIKLANKTGSKNAEGAIQTALRTLTITGITMTGFTASGDSAYDAAPPTGASVGTKASVLLNCGNSKTLTIGSGYAGSWYNDLSFAIEVATDDTLAVAHADGLVTIKLANTTASKNTAAAIQAAIRGLTVSGLNMDAFTVTASAEYTAAPPVGGTAAGVVLEPAEGKTLTISPGVAGSQYNGLMFAVDTAADDNLAVAEASGVITISLANGTANKNADSAIQAAIRALTVSGYDMTAFTVVGDAAYKAAPPIVGAAPEESMSGGSSIVCLEDDMAGGDESVIAPTALAGGADTICKIVLVA